MLSEFIQIHSLLSPKSQKGPFLSLVIYYLNITWNGYTFTIGKNRTFICENLENAGLLEQKCTFFILLGFDDNKELFELLNC